MQNGTNSKETVISIISKAAQLVGLNIPTNYNFNSREKNSASRIFEDSFNTSWSVNRFETGVHKDHIDSEVKKLIESNIKQGKKKGFPNKDVYEICNAIDPYQFPVLTDFRNCFCDIEERHLEKISRKMKSKNISISTLYFFTE